jgi:hypothetical protein
VAGRIKSVENSNDIRNRMLDRPACSVVPQTTTRGSDLLNSKEEMKLK